MAKHYVGTVWYKLALDLAHLSKNQNPTKTLSLSCIKCFEKGIDFQLRYQKALFIHLEEVHPEKVRHTKRYLFLYVCNVGNDFSFVLQIVKNLESLTATFDEFK
jgi:hypothetical protein